MAGDFPRRVLRSRYGGADREALRRNACMAPYPHVGDIVGDILMEPWLIGLTDEVRTWVDALPMSDRARVDALLGLLAERGELLRFPYCSQLEGQASRASHPVRPG